MSIQRMQIKDMDEISNAVFNTSFVQRMLEKIKSLKKENRSLKNLICSIPEFRCNCSSNKTTVKRCPLRKDVDPVPIKEEAVQQDKENIRMRLDEVEFIENRFKNVSLVDLVDDDEEEVVEEVVVKKVDVVEVEEEVEEVVEEVEVEEDEVEVEEEEEEVEEVEVEEEEVDVEEEEEEEEDEEEEVEVEAEEEEESEVFEITIGKKVYYTNNETNGTIYTVGQDEDVGDEVGSFVNGEPVFNVVKQ